MKVIYLGAIGNLCTAKELPLQQLPKVVLPHEYDRVIEYWKMAKSLPQYYVHHTLDKYWKKGDTYEERIHFKFAVINGNTVLVPVFWNESVSTEIEEENMWSCVISEYEARGKKDCITVAEFISELIGKYQISHRINKEDGKE